MMEGATVSNSRALYCGCSVSKGVASERQTGLPICLLWDPAQSQVDPRRGQGSGFGCSLRWGNSVALDRDTWQ